MNYLYPGQAPYVEVPGYGWIPYYDFPESIPVGTRGVVAVDRMAGAWDVGQTVLAREEPTPSGNAQAPGVIPLVVVVLVLILAIAVATTVGLYVDLVKLREYQEYEEVFDETPTPCDTGDCYSSSRRYGVCWYRYNCCTKTITPVNPECKNDPGGGDNFMDTIIKLLVIGAAAYVGFKIVLPALSKKKE